MTDRSFLEYFRCPQAMAAIGTRRDLSTADGFFQFDGVVAFGHVAGGTPASYATDALSDVSDRVVTNGQQANLPFNLTEVATNLREERYRQNGYNLLQRTTAGDAAQRLYYTLRPFMGVTVRKHLQKLRLTGWERISFPRWPVDVTVDALMNNVMRHVLKTSGQPYVPFVWFWPQGYAAAVMMTHDVEGQAGMNFSPELMEIDDAHGIKSAFQLIPEGRESAWRRLATRLRSRGFEVNLHDLNHDGHLFDSKEEFLRRARRINSYAREFGCEGFRSAVMYRQQQWFSAFEFAYDMSVPNAAHLEPQRGGCCTVMPYFVGNVLELPLTTVQDYTLWHILNDYSIELWKTQIDVIARHHGLVSVITHPDYLSAEPEQAVYAQLLRYLQDIREGQHLWMALPSQINRWWRNRRRMQLVQGADGWRIEGADSERARIAYATLQHDQVVYQFEVPAPIHAHVEAPVRTSNSKF